MKRTAFIAIMLVGFAPLLLLALPACGKKPPQDANADAGTAPAPVSPPGKIGVPEDLSNEARKAIVVKRVDEDVHGLAATYPDRDLRMVLELIAANSGVHPKKIPLDVALVKDPVAFDMIDMADMTMSLQEILGVRIPDDEIDDKADSLTPRDLLGMVQRARKGEATKP